MFIFALSSIDLILFRSALSEQKRQRTQLLFHSGDVFKLAFWFLQFWHLIFATTKKNRILFCPLAPMISMVQKTFQTLRRTFLLLRLLFQKEIRGEKIISCCKYEFLIHLRLSTKRVHFHWSVCLTVLWFLS